MRAIGEDKLDVVAPRARRDPVEPGQRMTPQGIIA
jgi:hypothetical protein